MEPGVHVVRGGVEAQGMGGRRRRPVFLFFFFFFPLSPSLSYSSPFIAAVAAPDALHSARMHPPAGGVHVRARAAFESSTAQRATLYPLLLFSPFSCSLFLSAALRLASAALAAYVHIVMSLPQSNNTFSKTIYFSKHNSNSRSTKILLRSARARAPRPDPYTC